MRSTSGTFSTVASLPDERPALRMLAGVRWSMLVAALLLSAIGLVTVHSASAELATDYLPRQALWVGVGLLVFLLAFSLDYQMLTKFSVGFYVLSLILLGLVLFLGQEAGGARSWLGIGAYRLQPSEFAKIATALFLARYLASRPGRYLRTHEIVVAGLIVLAPMILVALESDLGGALMFIPMLAGMAWLAGIEWRFVAVVSLIMLVAGGALWMLAMQDYQQERVRTFLSPERDPLGAGYQLQQSKIAVGQDSFWVGDINREPRVSYASCQRDTPISSLPCWRKSGAFWGWSVLALYVIYILNGARVAFRARDRVGILLVVGLLSAFGFHVLYNTAMVVGLVPITGIPLPFLSYGGSFTLANFIATGLILGVDFRRHVNR